MRRIFLTPSQQEFYNKKTEPIFKKHGIKMNLLSVVIPYKQSRYQELRYCLRSIEKNLKGYANIILVGDLPNYINTENLIYLPKKDTARKQESIRRKIETAMADERCTEWFAFWNDDYVLMKETHVKGIKNYHYGDLSRVSEKGAKNLYRDLIKMGKPTRHFDIHVPIIYGKEKFREAMKRFEWVDRDFVIKSLYANWHELKGEELPDLKINTNLSLERIRQAIGDRWIFSYGDYGLNQPMVSMLNQLFPEPSRYELNQHKKAA